MYIELGLKSFLCAKIFLELKLKKEIQGQLIGARSGHGNFNIYQKRFENKETDENCVCQERRAQVHSFSNLNAKEHWLYLWCKKRQKQLSPEEVLRPLEKITFFTKQASATGFFHRFYNNLDVFRKQEDNSVQEEGET